MKEKLKVCWLSAGVSSFIAGWLERDTVDEYYYIDVEDQHPDSLRFIRDCETYLSKRITVLRSPYSNVENVIRATRFIGSSRGAKCTEILKKRVRKEWEFRHQEFDITYIWGFDYNEKERADRLLESMPQFEHEFPLIDRKLTKADCHGICAKLGLKRPIMYDLGYNNNNCVGCVKGGIGYWNKIRVDFPDVFQARAKLERELDQSILYDKNGKLFLDELDPKRGRFNDEIMEDCSIACQLALY